MITYLTQVASPKLAAHAAPLPTVSKKPPPVAGPAAWCSPTLREIEPLCLVGRLCPRSRYGFQPRIRVTVKVYVTLRSRLGVAEYVLRR